MNASDDIDDVLVVGAGPAGTSAALALAGSGLRVRLVDGGDAAGGIGLPPEGDWLDLRRRDPAQWRWQLGDRFEALGSAAGTSPKLRVPGLRRIFDGFAQANGLVGENGFPVVGALAAGGMANAWGCGVAGFDDADLAPLDAGERAALREGYRTVSLRMGLSGRADDDLAAQFGIDEWMAPAMPMDPMHAALYARRRQLPAGFHLGRPRLAVLAGESRPGRAACDQRGMCLWGCTQRATWSPAFDLPDVARAGVAIERGVLVRALQRDGDGWAVHGTLAGGAPRTLRARRVLLAAGTLASTRLALAAMPAPPAQLPLRSNPIAAFLVFVPGRFGQAHARGFGLAQLVFTVTRADAPAAYGGMYATTGLPVTEFLGYVPLARRAGLPLLRALLPACTVGNVFLPGELSNHSVALAADGTLRIRGAADPGLPAAFGATRAAVASGLRAAGAWMLPGSFVPGQPGGDLHYASTLPMRAAPQAHECTTKGEIVALPGVHAIDGASLSRLPARPHTLTIMANADRIARHVAATLRA